MRGAARRRDTGDGKCHSRSKLRLRRRPRHPCGRRRRALHGRVALTPAQPDHYLIRLGNRQCWGHSQEAGLANTPSAEKRIRQAQKRYEHNRAQRSRMKTGIKRVLGATDAQSGDVALREVYALLDRLASRRVIHPNKAARKKSQLARHVASLS
jgi:small subunit ribosomal protein S20